LCDTVALIQNGKFLSIDSPEGTVSQFKKPLWAVKADNMYKLQHDLKQFEGMASVYPFGEYYHLALNRDNILQEDISDYLSSKIHQGIEINPIIAGIEDVFMELMKSTDD
jgi:ABC-2 type transport system ATP-binding protein